MAEKTVIVADKGKFYTRVLVARHSPENGCNAPDGELLVAARFDGYKDRVKRSRNHYFVGVASGKRSRYGWVHDAPSPITAEGLASLVGIGADPDAVARAEVLLDAVDGKDVGTPCACHLVETVSADAKRTLRLRVQKVIFYRPQDTIHFSSKSPSS